MNDSPYDMPEYSAADESPQQSPSFPDPIPVAQAYPDRHWSENLAVMLAILAAVGAMWFSVWHQWFR